MKGPIHRRASRLILLDGQRRILLLRHAGVNGQSFWAPPGGGLENGETFEEAAIREASEELGLTHPSLTRLWERVTDFIYLDHAVTQHEWFFLVEKSYHPSTDPLQGHAKEGILEMRWWTMDEIASAEEPIFPEDLTSEVRKIRN